MKQNVAAPLTLSKIKRILESPTYKANRNILVYKDFVEEARNIFCELSVEDRYNFFNNHLNESKLNKWHDQKSKFMDISKGSSQNTPLSISWYNFTYQHTPIQASKIWQNFINLMIDFEQGAAECDLTKCKKADCRHHLTIIDGLYAFVNTSDDSLYAISTQEFTVRGGFKLLLKIFAQCGINSPIPPLILCSHQYQQHAFLSHFAESNHHFLFAISPNEVRFSWIKQMLHNAHPIMSEKRYLHQLLETFYPKPKQIVKKDVDDNVVFDIDDEKKMEAVSKTKRAVIETGRMAEMGVLSWLLVTLPTLLDIRRSQKKLLSKEFDKYSETAANSTLIDSMLDYLYWEEKYILKQIAQVRDIIICNKNELILFNYISNEYGGNVAMAMFIKQFIGIHMDINQYRNSLEVLFDNDSFENNAFYFKLIRHIFGSNSMVSHLDDYLPFLLSKIVWNCSDGLLPVNQLLFDHLLSAILSYIERFVSDQSMMTKIVKKWTYANAKDSNKNSEMLSKLVNVRREKTKRMVLQWIIKILKLLDWKQYTQQFVYQLSLLHFKTIYQNECVEEFTLKLFQELMQNGLIFGSDLMDYYIDCNTHILRELTVSKSECILWLLCRCCFDKAIDIFLFNQNVKGNKMENLNLLFMSKQIDGKYNNVFLSLSQSVMSNAVTNASQMQCARVNILKMLCEYGKINNLNIEDIKKCLSQKDKVNGKNSLQYALANNYQPLYNEMKQLIS